MRVIFNFCVLVVLSACAMTTMKTEKINGVSYVASRAEIDSTHVKPVVAVNANYAAIMPFGFMRQLDQPKIVHNTDRQWFGETRAGAHQYIKELRQKDIKIMIKPQIWVWRGEFTGYIEMTSEANWKALEASYKDFILEYADLAQELNVELFCIGTELERFVLSRPDYWKTLINEIRKIYKGKLTYAANWDEFKRTPFWDQLDYIGLDAYFPVSDSKTPTVEECIAGWQEHKTLIKRYHDSINKPVLFTEYGYRSVDFSGREPWKADHTMVDVNLEAQVNTTKALFEVFWKEDWFAGGFIWKWFHAHDRVGGLEDSQFTPQNKPVEDLIRVQYAQHQ